MLTRIVLAYMQEGYLMWNKLVISIVFGLWFSSLTAKPLVQSFVDVNYITGGVSIEEEAMIAEMARDYTLKVTNALKCGDYLTNINILIMDASDNIVLETDTNGPILYANLTKGKYTVYASAFGERYKKPTRIKEGVQRQLVFYWPTEPKPCPGD